jgi:hypothetical protein
MDPHNPGHSNRPRYKSVVFKVLRHRHAGKCFYYNYGVAVHTCKVITLGSISTNLPTLLELRAVLHRSDH